ncbi:hypothetical protein WJX72_006807 [[Myrmecia] bisecta]|uniref:Mitochondrial import receptor subunit TOM7-1 n=1 Tax=[Myrmecia] bisecta TaxID=41462 RepID=A0AAW1PNZ2_9CHLO
MATKEPQRPALPAKKKEQKLDKDAVLETLSSWSDYLIKKGKPIVHVGFIPLIIVLGMTCTEPRPSLAQLLGPM